MTPRSLRAHWWYAPTESELAPDSSPGMVTGVGRLVDLLSTSTGPQQRTRPSSVSAHAASLERPIVFTCESPSTGAGLKSCGGAFTPSAAPMASPQQCTVPSSSKAQLPFPCADTAT